VARFHEKPKAELANRFCKEEGYFWNSGMFVFRADLFAAEAERHMPAVWRAAAGAVHGGSRKEGRLLLQPESFSSAPKTSIDYALLEKSQRVGVVPVSFEWSDVGNWASVHDALAKDTSANAIVGDVVTRDSAGTLMIGDGPRLVVIGVKDLVVVANSQGIFIAPMSRAGEIKTILEE
jgi:mannose-1-phosphate guanylyltransferase